MSRVHEEAKELELQIKTLSTCTDVHGPFSLSKSEWESLPDESSKSLLWLDKFFSELKLHVFAY